MDGWIIAGVLAAISQTLIIAIAALVAVRQLRETSRQRKFDALLRVYRTIGSSDARENRRAIYEELPNSPEKLTPEQWRLVGDVAVMFDHIGALAKFALIDEKELLETHGPMIARLWSRLEPYIQYERARLGPGRVAAFEALAKRSQEILSNNR
jgi:hypothetical protein